MKNLKIILAVSTLALATNSFAEDYIFSEHYVSNPPATRYFTIQDYAGVSKLKPCSDLKLYSSEDGYSDFSDNTYNYDSAAFVYRYGQAATCVKRTLTMTNTGNVYSTGNVKVTWNDTSKKYTNASPKAVTMDVSKG